MGKSNKTEAGRKRAKKPKRTLTAAEREKLKKEEIVKDLYKPEYCKKMKDFFNAPEKYGRPFPTFEGFANIIGVTRATVYNWSQEYPAFAKVYEAAKDRQKELLCIGALSGAYNAQFAKFFATNENGMKEKIETDQKIVYNVSLPDEIADEGD